MSSPITLSGFNNIDFKSIIDIIIKSERAPISRLQAQQTSEQTRLSAYGTLSSNLSTLESAIAALQSDSAYGNSKATSSDTSVLTASSTSSASKGSFTVNVSTVARPQVTASAERQFDDINAPIIDGGAFSITQNGATTSIDLTGVESLVQLRDAINSQQSGVKASIINDGSSADSPARPFRLILTSVNAGASNAFTVDDQTTYGGGAAGATLNLSTDATNGVAQDTVLTYRGITVRSTSTTITDAVDGLTLQVLKTGSATITVSDDDSSLKEKIKAFVAAFNSFGEFAQAQFKPAAAGSNRPALATDSLLRGINRLLRSALTSDLPNSGSVQNLAHAGIKLDRAGKLEVDEAQLDSALSSNPADVETFFSGASGFAARMSDLIESYAEAGGAISILENSTKKRIDTYAARILDMESQLSLREEVLTNQFAAADRAISQMNSQANALAGLSSQYRLF